MLEQIRQRLGEEAEALLHELNITLPREIEKAVAQGDLRENSEYTAALERQGFVGARLEYLARRMSQLGEIDIEHVPVDRIGFGSKVEVRDANGQVEVFSITIGEDLDFDADEISMESPIGRALLGKRPGDTVSVTLPSEARELEVLSLVTWHELMEESA
jgi:transcription elongation factor GreA